MSGIPRLPVTAALALAVAAHASGAGSEADAVARVRIRQAVPAVLTPCSAIERITVAAFRGAAGSPARSISDPATIDLLCGKLRDTVVQEQFQVGHQVHSPAEAIEITFIQRSKPALKLVSVGDDMFWISWDGQPDSQQRYNLQSASFAQASAGYFRLQEIAGSVPADFALRIQRSGCEGRCPEYVLQLDAVGAVTWNGLANVGTLGEARATIGPAPLQAIVGRVRSERWTGAPKKAIACLDTPRVAVTSTLDGAKRTLTFDTCALRQTVEGRKAEAFVSFVESTLGVDRWRR